MSWLAILFCKVEDSVNKVVRALLCGAAMFGSAQIMELSSQVETRVAATPPMGWNSWDSYGLTITEAQFRENVKVQRDKLKPFGWNYAVIDEGWFFQNPEARPHPQDLLYQFDAFGRYVPVPARFPSSEGAAGSSIRKDGSSTIDAGNRGFIELGRWVHAQGLKFGIHIVRGIPRESTRINAPIESSAFHAEDAADKADACPWDPTNWGVRDNAAGQAWYDSLLRQYASWGVDLLKVDCISDHPYKLSEIEQIRRAIDKSGRPMVLSLSPGPTALAHAAEVSKLAQMWRISDDIWDVWARADENFPQTVKSQFPKLAAWSKYAGPGHWPDADMLPIGELSPKPDIGPGARHTRLTLDEQRTQLTLWSVARSPLILGANLTLLDARTLSMLTNREFIRINQTATTSREVLNKGDLIAWSADLPSGEMALAIFNIGDGESTERIKLSDIGVAKREKSSQMKNVWTGKTESVSEILSLTLPAHSSELYILKQ